VELIEASRLAVDELIDVLHEWEHTLTANVKGNIRVSTMG
jgi:hypothetical protein